MSKSKHAPEFRAMVAQEYIDGAGSTYELAEKYHVGRTTLQKWVALFREQGIKAFITQEGNKSYTKEFKITCVEMVLSGIGSSVEIAAQNNIHLTVLESWIKLYNCPKREVYMAEARRKTTIEERKEIVEYCIEHGLDYKGTASIYDVSYSQVYSWVKKYNYDGVDGLTDKRGHHKQDDEVDELERLRRENIRLKRQLEEKDMLAELLKKVQEFERM